MSPSNAYETRLYSVAKPPKDQSGPMPLSYCLFIYLSDFYLYVYINVVFFLVPLKLVKLLDDDHKCPRTLSIHFV